MGRRTIKCSIDVKALDKKKMRPHKSGKIFADITLIETPGGTYGDWMIVENKSKEENERDPGKKATILGNGKNYGWDKPSGSTQQSNVSSDDLPY